MTSKPSLSILIPSILALVAGCAEPGDTYHITEEGDTYIENHYGDDDDSAEEVEEVVYSEVGLRLFTEATDAFSVFPPTVGPAMLGIGIEAPGGNVHFDRLPFRMVGDLSAGGPVIVENSLGDLLESAHRFITPGDCQLNVVSSGRVTDVVRVWDEGLVDFDAITLTAPADYGIGATVQCALSGNIHNYGTDIVALAVELVPELMEVYDDEGLPIHPDNIEVDLGSLNPMGVNRTVTVLPGAEEPPACLAELILNDASPYGAHCDGTVPATDTVSNGMLIQHATIDMMYYYADGVRYPMAHGSVLESWYGDDCTLCNEVYNVSDELLATIPLGYSVTIKPGSFIVVLGSMSDLYVVDTCRTLRSVTPAMAQALYGEDWNDRIRIVPDVFFVDYSLGDAVLDAADYNPAQPSNIIGEAACGL